MLLILIHIYDTNTSRIHGTGHFGPESRNNQGNPGVTIRHQYGIPLVFPWESEPGKKKYKLKQLYVQFTMLWNSRYFRISLRITKYFILCSPLTFSLSPHHVAVKKLVHFCMVTTLVLSNRLDMSYKFCIKIPQRTAPTTFRVICEWKKKFTRLFCPYVPRWLFSPKI